MAEAKKYAGPGTCFTFTISGAAEGELAEIRSHLEPWENELVKLEGA